jgi:DNA-binding CsgD family transcriptional regulator
MINKFLGLRVSDAERYVAMHCIKLGTSRKHVADKLGISVHTLKNQMYSVYNKMGVDSLSELQAGYIKLLEERLRKYE